MHRVVAAEGGNERRGQALNEAIADTDRVRLVGVEWSCRIEHSLVIFDNGCRHRLTIRPHRRLTNVFENSVRLVAVPWAQLHEN